EQWPQLRFTLPELQFPDIYNASSILDRTIEDGFGAHNAVLCASSALTYEALLRETCRIAHVLRCDFGLAPGNRVLIHASNTLWSIAIWWAVFRAGGIAVGAMPMLRAHELAVILNKAQVSHAIVDTHRTAELAQAQRDAPTLRHILPMDQLERRMAAAPEDRKSTRLNSSHVKISY